MYDSIILVCSLYNVHTALSRQRINVDVYKKRIHIFMLRIKMKVIDMKYIFYITIVCYEICRST